MTIPAMVPQANNCANTEAASQPGWPLLCVVTDNLQHSCLGPETHSPSPLQEKTAWHAQKIKRSGSCVTSKIISNPSHHFLLYTDGIRIFSLSLRHYSDLLIHITSSLQPPTVVQKYVPKQRALEQFNILIR